jgi:hypothetical protein
MALRQDLDRLRRAHADLLSAPTISRAPRSWAPDIAGAAGPLFTLKAGLGPAFTTQSNSGLIVYDGPVLGVRQLLLTHARRTAEPLPPGFADASSDILAMLALRLAVLRPDDRLGVMPSTAPRHVRAMVEAWEDSGLGPWAWPCFALAHVYLPKRHTWAQLTPQAEALTR